MIFHLKGQLFKVFGGTAVIDVKGVSYGVEVGDSLINNIESIGSEVEFWIYTDVGEDRLRLFGFRSFEERAVFEILVSINGVGPRVAQAMISTLGIEGIRSAAVNGLPEKLTVVPRIGKRTAEKILVELKAKADKLLILASSDGNEFTLGRQFSAGGAIGSPVVDDVSSALVNLGYKKPNIDKALRELIKESSKFDFDSLFKMALAALGTTTMEKVSVRQERELF